MSTGINALLIRRRLGRNEWRAPIQFGPDGWRFHHYDDRGLFREVLVTADSKVENRHGEIEELGWEYVHASIVRRAVAATYEDMKLLHYAVWGGDGYAYQVFAPGSQHVNIHSGAYHLWGRLDGQPMMPEFGTTSLLRRAGRPVRSI